MNSKSAAESVTCDVAAEPYRNNSPPGPRNTNPCAYLPVWLDNTAGLLGQLTIPLMLLTLGVSLSSMKIADFKMALPLGIGRVWVGALIGLAVAELLGLEGTLLGGVCTWFTYSLMSYDALKSESLELR